MLTQLVLARFNAQGTWRLHMRRMRALYARRRGVLLDALRTQAGDSSMLRTFPKRPARARDLQGRRRRRALQRALPGGGNQGGSAVDLLCRKGPRGLIIGFASTPEERIPAAVGTLVSVLRRQLD